MTSLRDLDRLRTTWAFNITAVDSVRTVYGPPGVEGYLRDIHFAISTAFNEVTTEGLLELGDGTDVDRYASFAMGSTAIGANLSLSQQRGGRPQIWMPESLPVVLTYTAPTGGSPAGVADVYVTIDWKGS